MATKADMIEEIQTFNDSLSGVLFELENLKSELEFIAKTVAGLEINTVDLTAVRGLSLPRNFGVHVSA